MTCSLDLWNVTRHPCTKCGQNNWVSTKFKIKIISSSRLKMNYLHCRCHVSFPDVSPQIIPHKKPGKRVPIFSPSHREEYETIKKGSCRREERDKIHNIYPTKSRSSGTMSHLQNCLLGISCKDIPPHFFRK